MPGVAERTATARRSTRDRHPTVSARSVARRSKVSKVSKVAPIAPVAPSARSGLSAVPTATALGILVVALCVVGLVMVGSASPVISLGLYGSPWTILIRQGIWMAIGAVALVLCSRVDYRRWRALRAPLVLVGIGLLVVVLVPGLGDTAGGSSRWIGVGQLRMQPSELMKLALVVFAADLLTRRVDRMDEPKLVIAPVLGVLLLSGALILKQPDMGTALVLGCIAFGVLFVGGVPMFSLLKVFATFATLALILGLADPYRRDRILSFLNPGAHQSGSGYQVWQSLIGLGAGHLFGLGLGGGREKWGSLPNAHTDFIFSVVGEELGMVGAVAVLALFLALAWFGVRAASRAPDRFGSMLAIGVTTWITSQAVINVGAVVGVLPVTGIPLPFISFGGSSLVITMAAVGILLNIAVQERSGNGAARPRRLAARA